MQKNNHKDRSFNYVFEKIDLTDDIRNTFKNTIVEDVNIDEIKKVLKIKLKDKWIVNPKLYQN